MLLGAGPSAIAVMLRRGSSGAAVTNLQQKLAAAGFSPGAIDGKFGPATESAVRMFQTSRGLTVDGIVGPNTAGALGLALPEGMPAAGGGAIIPTPSAAAAGDAGAAGEGLPWGYILGGIGALGVIALVVKGKGSRPTARNPRRRRRHRARRRR